MFAVLLAMAAAYHTGMRSGRLSTRPGVLAICRRTCALQPSLPVVIAVHGANGRACAPFLTWIDATRACQAGPSGRQRASG